MPATAVRVSKKIYDSVEELNLVHRAKRHDESAFTALYQMHHTRVFVTIKRMIPADEDANWIANKALTKVWHKLNSFKEQSKFSTWITRIAINEARMHLRSEKRHIHDVSLDSMIKTADSKGDKISDPVDPVHTASKWLAHRDLNLEGIADRHLLERAITRVPSQFRRTLRLRFWEGLSLDEIQTTLSAEEATEVSISAVKSRILRGKRALIKQIERSSKLRGFHEHQASPDDSRG